VIRKFNRLRLGATRQGKTLSAARDVVEATGEAAVILDPHKQSFAQAVLAHADGNVLYDCLSDLAHPLSFDLLAPSSHPDSGRRQMENMRRAESFVSVLLRRRDSDSLAGTPLMEEWVMAAIMLFLLQKARKPLTVLPHAFLPGSDEFAALVKDCTLPEIRHKFRQLEKLTPRALRAEVGSATRLVSAVFHSPAFQARCGGGFDLGRFLQDGGVLVVERGEDVGDDAMRTIMGAVIHLTIEHAKRRPSPYPPIRIYIDEATNAGLVGRQELRGIAETNKNGLYWDFLVQNLNFPGGADEVLQNCPRHEWFGCPNYDLARKAAADYVAGLPWDDEESRTKLVAKFAAEIMQLPPGWRCVRDPGGSRKEYVPLLKNPWPDWPGLREAKLEAKLRRIRARPEYGAPDTPTCTTSCADTPPPSSNSQDDSSPAERWRRKKGRPTDGSSNSDAGNGSP
jgi:hypothetical protein